MNEVKVDNELEMIAQKVKDIQVKETRNTFLREKLLELFPRLPKPFSFALDSRMEASNFSIEDCKVMDSKKVPLWLAVIPEGVEDDENLGFISPQ